MQKTFKKLSKTQADGAQVYDVTECLRNPVWQLQVDVSAVPTAGTMTVEIKTPGADDYVSLGSINLVAGPLAVRFDAFTTHDRITPVLFDALKTYDAYLFALQV